MEESEFASVFLLCEKAAFTTEKKNTDEPVKEPENPEQPENPDSKETF